MTESAWATPIHLEIRGVGDAALVVDGVDLIPALNVQAIDFHAEPNTVPIVTLHAIKPFTYDGPAEINHTVDPLVSLVGFLDAVDPTELEAAALERIGGLGGPTTGQCFLSALKDMAEAAMKVDA